MKEENLDIFVVGHISHFGKDPHYTDKELKLLHKCKQLFESTKDLKRTQIRKEKIKKILCQD